MPQSLEATIVVMAGAADRHAQPLGDLAQRQVLEAGQLERRTLPRRQLGEPGAQDPAAFLRREPRQMIGSPLVERFDRFSPVRRAASKSLLAAERPMIDVLQQPDANGSPLRRIEVRFAVDLEEDFLGDVFGFGAVVEDAAGDAVDQTDVAMKEAFERVRFVGADVTEQFRVGSCAGGRVVNLNRC
jgi:hypothetical protein